MCGQVSGISINGGEEGGKQIEALATQRRILFQAELGGNNPVVLGSTNQVGHALIWTVRTAFGFSGQRCTATRRLIFRRDQQGRVLEGIVQALLSLKSGRLEDRETDFGPVVDKETEQRLLACLDAAETAGAQLIVDGREQLKQVGWLGPSIVLTDNPQLEIVQNESFGPILVLQPADHWDEALSLLNGVRQGLSAALFSEQQSEVDSFKEHAAAFTLRVNPVDGSLHPLAPFGGRKASGIGLAEHGEFDRLFYAEPQTVYASTSSSAPVTEAWDPVDAWRQRATELLQSPGLPHHAPEASEIATYRAHLSKSAAQTAKSPRLLVLGATTELLALGSELNWETVCVDANLETFALAERRLAHAAQGASFRQVVADWSDLGSLQLGRFDAICGDVALNNVKHRDMRQVVAELSKVLKPGGRVILKQVVLPKGTTAFDLRTLAVAHASGSLSDVEFRMAVRFGCFHTEAYDSPARVLDGGRVHAVLQDNASQHGVSQSQLEMLMRKRSHLKHTVYSIKEQLSQLSELGVFEATSASDQLHHEQLVKFFVSSKPSGL